MSSRRKKHEEWEEKIIGFEELDPEYGTPPFELLLVTEKQIRTLLDLSKIHIPMICNKYKAVDDPGTSLKIILDTAQKERENAAKVPQLKKQNVEKKADDGSIVVEERIKNPYNGFLDDDVVKKYHEEYTGQWDKGADDCGFPDKFVYETVKAYLWQYKFSLAVVAGNGNCMANAILLQLGWEGDPDGESMYNHLYLRRQAVRHLLTNWDKLGKKIARDITMQYGRPDSEINGQLIAKEKRVKGKIEKIYGFSVLEWCEYVLKDKFWLDEIFLKIVASMWSCRITVMRCDSLRTVDYRHSLFWSQADIKLMYNCSPFMGHYSAVLKNLDEGGYECAMIEPVKFTENYRKFVDLDERLKRNETPWDLDRERYIFTMKRGYKFQKEDKEELEGSKEGEKSGEKSGGGIELGEDEIIVKKEDWEKMKEELGNLKKEVEKVKDLEKEVKRLKELAGEEEDKVVVPEKSMETLRDHSDSLKRKFDQVMEGEEPDGSGTTSGGKGGTPKKSRPHDPDEPPDPTISKLVKRKRVDVRREIAEDLPPIEKGSTVCPVCKEDYCTQNALVAHYSKFHKNEYLYHCKMCKKGLMSELGYKLHMQGHKEEERLECEEPKCKELKKTFGSKSALKKHMKEQHPTEEQKKAMKNIKCQFCKKHFKTKDNKNEHELGCILNLDREEVTCEVCDLGGFYVNKRVLEHKRKCHGWEG